MKPKILLFDLETAPNKAYIWGMWMETRSMEFITDYWYVLCWSAKWLGKDKVYSAGIKSRSTNDKAIIRKLCKLLDEADIVVAHNAIKFDHRRINARFIMHGIAPPSPYRIVDTLKDARRHFDFVSNRLGDLGIILKLGEKINTGGFTLWAKCMEGNKKAWKKMMGYCDQDVLLLEKVYLALRPYISNHPNIGAILERECCPKCGSDHIQYRGYTFTTAGKYRRFQCMTCTGWGKHPQKVSKNKTLRNI